MIFQVLTKLQILVGGYGKLLIKILNKHVNAKGILFDLPNVIKEIKESNEKIGDNNRLELISGNFF